MREEKVGGLTLRRGAPSEGDDQLEIRTGESTVGPATGPGPIMVLVMILGSALLVFAVLVRSLPAMATVGAALSAMAWLVMRRRTRRAASGSIAVGSEGVRVVTAERASTTPFADVEAFGIGESGATHTLWMQVVGEGRVLVFEGLDDDEAEAAEAAIDEAMRLRRRS